MKSTIFSLLLCFAVNVIAAESMGLRTHFLADSTRSHWVENKARPMLIHSFYPSAESAVPLTFGPSNNDFFISGRGQRNAPLTELQRGIHPLAIISHGTGGGVLQMGWLAQALVSRGFIVVGVNHHGNTFMEPYLPQGFAHYWERPQDVLFTLNWALTDSPYNEFIDHSKIALVGFSLGGYTVLANAGGITDREYFIHNFCESTERDATCDPIPEMPNLREAYAPLVDDPKVLESLTRQKKSFVDSRIKAVVSIAPPGHIFSPESLSNIDVPVLILVGDKDKITPAQSNARYLVGRIRNAEYQEILLGGHYSMLGLCTPQGMAAMPALCTEHTPRERLDIHGEVSKLTSEFLMRQLYENPSNKPSLGSAAIH